VSAPLLHVSHVTKVFGGPKPVTALQDVSLVIPGEPATITTVVGESGSGKSTLANAILGFLVPTSGRILFAGRDVATLRGREWLAYRRQVQAVFQDPFSVYNPFYRVRHVFDTVIRRFELAHSRREAQRMVGEALEVVGLRPELLDKYPHQLSGGQRQRLMMARAYLIKPRLIVADEPVSMIDASLRALILGILLRLRDEEQISFLYITHDLSTAYQVSDEILVLYRGRVVESGDAQKVIERPEHPYTRLLISSVPVPDPRVRWEVGRMPEDLDVD